MSLKIAIVGLGMAVTPHAKSLLSSGEETLKVHRLIERILRA